MAAAVIVQAQQLAGCLGRHCPCLPLACPCAAQRLVHLQICRQPPVAWPMANSEILLPLEWSTREALPLQKPSACCPQEQDSGHCSVANVQVATYCCCRLLTMVLCTRDNICTVHWHRTQAIVSGQTCLCYELLWSSANVLRLWSCCTLVAHAWQLVGGVELHVQLHAEGNEINGACAR